MLWRERAFEGAVFGWWDGKLARREKHVPRVTEEQPVGDAARRLLALWGVTDAGAGHHDACAGGGRKL
jgi:hypothetical protein